MRVTIEDGVYSLIEVRIESMFDNGKGRMIRTTDILVRVGMRGNLVGARRRPSKSGSEREGVGSGESRKGELWNEKFRDRVRFFKWISWQYLQHLKSYNMGCH